MQVLVAEDDRLERTILRAMVLRLGHTCIEAADGHIALRLFGEFKPDVVISDWLMPGLQGPELCLRVRAAAGDRPLYFILQTVLANREHVVRASQVGVDAYIVKPVKLEDLTARLAAAEATLTTQRATRPPTPPEEVPQDSSDPEVPAIDESRLADYRDANGNPSDLLFELVQIFREDTPIYLENLRLAILHGDAKALSQSAHSLKGSTSAIGAHEMHTICLELERLALDGDVAKSNGQLRDLKLAFERAVRALELLTRDSS